MTMETREQVLSFRSSKNKLFVLGATMSTDIPESPDATVSPLRLRAGLERHVWPSGNGKGIVTKTSSDAIFGPEGLGLANSIWMTILSNLARTGIQEQTCSLVSIVIWRLFSPRNF